VPEKQLTREKRYWNSDTFLAHLKREETRIDACKGVLDAAEEGKVHIITSALTLAEVIKLKRRPPIEKADAEKIRAFSSKTILLSETLTAKQPSLLEN